MTHRANPRANYRISRQQAAAHRRHGAVPHLGCVLCYLGTVRPR